MLESLFNEVSGRVTCNVVKNWLKQRCFHVNFCEVLKNTWQQLVLNQLGIRCSECRLEEEKEYKIEDNPRMFWWVICTCDQRYYKINYKYERCKHTKTKSCYKNISCWFIESFALFISSSLWWFKIWFVFHPTNLINKNTSDFLKKLIKQKCFKFCCIPYQIYLIPHIWSN